MGDDNNIEQDVQAATQEVSSKDSNLQMVEKAVKVETVERVQNVESKPEIGTVDKKPVEQLKPEEDTERLFQQRQALSHAKAVAHAKVEASAKGFEEILRIVHGTNWKNQILAKKNIYEIELICKNALLELKGV